MRPLAYLKLLCSPWRYDEPRSLQELDQRLRHLYNCDGGETWLLTANGRTALYLALRALNASPEDEVLVQAFTCVASVNPILWADLKSVFVDVDPATLGPSIDSMREKLTDRTRAIIVQHTFGFTAQIEEIVALARENGVAVIEDCAHALGAPVVGRKLGTDGQATVISFGIDKVLSTKAGGALLIRDPALQQTAAQIHARLPTLSRVETFRWLLFPLLHIALRRVPYPGARARITKWLEWSGILQQAVTDSELHGGRPPGTPSRMSGALAAVACVELRGLEDNLRHRSCVSTLYRRALDGIAEVSVVETGEGTPISPIQYPILLQTPDLRDHVKRSLSAAGIPVATWYDPPIFPRGIDFQKLAYNPATTPTAADLSARVLCLPTGRFVDESYVTDVARRVRASVGEFVTPRAYPAIP